MKLHCKEVEVEEEAEAEEVIGEAEVIIVVEVVTGEVVIATEEETAITILNQNGRKI